MHASGRQLEDEARDESKGVRKIVSKAAIKRLADKKRRQKGAAR